MRRSRDAVSAPTDLFIWDDHLGFDARIDADLDRLERWRTAGASFLSINVGYDVMPWHDAIRVLAVYRAWIEAHGDGYVLAASTTDVMRAREQRKIAVAFDLEGMVALDDRVEMIALYHRLGVRQIAFAYNRTNAFAGGCHDKDVGLTPLGRRALEEMNRLGILVDCSHTSLRSTMEAMERSRAPVVFSHSNPAAVWPHARNITDEQIVACATTGGVVGINGIGIFLGPNDASTATIVRHIDHVAELVGPRHVGIGLDAAFGDETETLLLINTHFWPPGHGYGTSDFQVAVPEQIPEIAAALIDRGYAGSDVDDIMGGNFLRVATEAWGDPSP